MYKNIQISEKGNYAAVEYPSFLEEQETDETPEPIAGAEEEKGEETPSTEHILKEAGEEAARMIKKAREEAERIRKETHEGAYVRGLEEGIASGRQQAYQELKKELEEEVMSFRKELEDFLEEAEHQKEKMLEEHLDDLKNIALAIGEKIVQTSLKSSSDVVRRMIVAAADRQKQTAWAKIYVAGVRDKSAGKVEGDARLLKELAGLSDNIKIIVMEEAAPGTCILELPHEIIDASAETQMENIKEILNNARI